MKTKLSMKSCRRVEKTCVGLLILSSCHASVALYEIVSLQDWSREPSDYAICPAAWHPVLDAEQPEKLS